MPRWGKGDDAKLKNLFINHKVDPNEQGTKQVKEVQEKYFPQYKFANFGPLYRRKAKEFNLEQTLQGARQGNPNKKRRTEDGNNHQLGLDSDSDDDSFKGGSVDIDCDDLDIESAIDEEEVGDLLQDLQDLTVARKPSISKKIITRGSSMPTSYSAGFRCPFVMYDYVHDDRKKVFVDFLVPTFGQDQFRPRIDPTGNFIELSIVLPEFFASNGRLLAANNSASFNQNTHKATALKNFTKNMLKMVGNENNLIVSQDVQRVKLPFQVEPNFEGWEYLLFTNDHAGLFQMTYEHQQYFAVITCEAKAIKVESKPQRGRGRIIGSPVPPPRRHPGRRTGGGGGGGRGDYGEYHGGLGSGTGLSGVSVDEDDHPSHVGSDHMEE